MIFKQKTDYGVQMLKLPSASISLLVNLRLYNASSLVAVAADSPAAAAKTAKAPALRIFDVAPSNFR